MTKWWLVGVIWLTAVLRFHGLFANHFQADEALFASWARLIAVWRDPLLQTQVVDKPPLLFYLQALAYRLFGPVEWAARIPSLAASLLLIPLTAVLAWRVSSRPVAAVVTALFLALTPLSIQFSATAFIDPLMTLFLIMACFLIVRPPVASKSSTRPALTGLTFGLAIATKYQAWLFLPLLIALGCSTGWGRREWLRWLLGFAPILFLLVVWTAARDTESTLWSQQMTNFGGVRIAWSWELWPRLLAWANLWHIALGLPLVLTTLFTIAVKRIALDHYPFIRSLSAAASPTGSFPAALKYTPCQISLQLKRWLWLFILAYSLLHWLLAVPIWDRYLLPLIPFIAVLVGSGITVPRTSRFAAPRLTTALFIALLLLQLPFALAARQGQFPIGGQPTADHGAAEIGQYLADAPYGTVLYDHWYSWHWRYHFFDRGVYVSWFPHPQVLVEDLNVFGRQPPGRGAARYLALPATAVAQPVIRAVEDAGFRLQPVYRARQMVLYQVEAR